MGTTTNKLLAKLMALGVATAIGSVAAHESQAQASRAHVGAIATERSEMVDLVAKIELLRVYPNSPMAKRMLAQVLAQIASLPAPVRAALVERIPAGAALPSAVAEALGMAAGRAGEVVATATQIY